MVFDFFVGGGGGKGVFVAVVKVGLWGVGKGGCI